MKNLWNKHEEAQQFAATVSNPPVRTILRGIHNLLLESAGFVPEHFLHPPIVPSTPLDVLKFYILADKTFSDQEAMPDAETAVNSHSDHLVRSDEAISLIESIPFPRCRSYLNRFLALASVNALLDSVNIDAFYCCRILAVILSDDSNLNHILSGAAEREAIELLKEWFG